MRRAEVLAAVSLRILALLALLALSAALPAQGEDCDGNGVEDGLDLAPAFGLAGASVYGTGNSAAASSAGDLDGDGRPDLAVAFRVPPSVAVLRGLGGHDFAPQVSHLLPLPPLDMDLADLDGDGDLDTCAAGDGFPASGAVFLLWNDGAGGLSEPERLPLDLSPWALAVADLDGDGRADIAAADRPANQIKLLRSAGGGAFTEGIPIPTGRGPVALAPADLDRDGDLDVASANELASTLTVAWNEGGGTFSPDPGRRAGRLPRRLAAADLDGDGFSDLALMNRASLDINIFVNEGMRSLGEGTTFSLGEEPADVTAADLDGDGDADLAVLQNGTEGAELISGNARPHGLVTVFVNGGGGAWSRRPSLPVGETGAAMTSADLDAGGIPEVALALDRAGLAVLWNPGAALHDGAIRRPVFTRDPFAAGDFDRDGDPDIILLQKGLSPAVVLWNAGQGDYTEESEVPVTFANAILAADLDGDGDSDLAFADKPAPWQQGPETIAFFWNEGDAGFQRGTPIPVSPRAIFLAAGDTDGDLDLDLVYTDGGRNLSFLPSAGRGTYGDLVSMRFDESVNAPLAADLDGDGDADVALPIEPRFEIIRDEDGSIAVNEYGEPVLVVVEPGAAVIVLSEGPGLHRVAGRIAAARWPSAMAAGDLDGDGDLDLAVADRDARAVAAWLNDGRAAFAPGAARAVNSSPRSLADGDLDGDGDLDLACVGEGPPAAWALLNDGRGTFSVPRGFAVSGDPYFVKALDIDGTGSLAIVALCRGSEELWILKNRTLPARATDCDGNGRPDSCDLASGEAADADGDGFPDSCGASFRRGDVNADGRTDLSDALRILGFLFLGDPPVLACAASADTDGGGRLDIADAVSLLAHLFLGAPGPAEPFRACGFDPAPGHLDCRSYTACP